MYCALLGVRILGISYDGFLALASLVNPHCEGEDYLRIYGTASGERSQSDEQQTHAGRKGHAVSFDLHLERLVVGQSTAVDKDAVLAVLRRHCQDVGDRWGSYNVRFDDGSHVEFSAEHLETTSPMTGCGFQLRGFSTAIISFVFEIAHAGDMVIFNAQGSDAGDTGRGPLAIVIHESQRAGLPPSIKRAAYCASPEHLAQLLGVSHRDWSRFRDRAIGKSKSGDAGDE